MYNEGPSARVTSLKIVIKLSAHPVWAKPPKNPPEKRHLMWNYIARLEKLGLVRCAERTEWMSAPLIVLKKSPALYQLKIDYSAVIAVIVKNTWPMRHVDAVLQERHVARAFAAIDFTSSY